MTDPTVVLDFADWFWQRCRAVTTRGTYGRLRCDLVRHHNGPHCSELGMWLEFWDDRTTMTTQEAL